MFCIHALTLHIIATRTGSRGIELWPEEPAGGEEVIVIEHEPELQAEVPPAMVDQGKHWSIYAY